MKHSDIEIIDAPAHGKIFCDKGDRRPRNSVKSIDPIVYDETTNSFDPSNGFGTVFSKPHRKLAAIESPDGVPLKYYNNYATASDFNLLFYIASMGTILPTIGYPIAWSNELAEKNNGYPWGAVVRDATGERYISVKNNNLDPVGSSSLSWIRYRNTNWYNLSDHVQPSSDNKSVTIQSQCTYLPMLGGGRVTGFEGKTAVVIYRLHSIRNMEQTSEVFTWAQAYKYWIGKEGQAIYLWCKIDGTFVKCANVESITEFNASTGKDVKSGPLKNIKQYYNSPGAYVVTWSDNPFSKVYEAGGIESTSYKVSNGTVSNSELALDAAMYGYGLQHMFVKPEFEEEKGVLTHEIDGDDLKVIHGIFRVGGEAVYRTDAQDPSDENMGIGHFLDTIDSRLADSEMGKTALQNVASPSNGIPLSEGLPGSIVPELPVSFDNGNAVGMFVDNGAYHNKLSSDPTIIRRGIEISLVFRQGNTDIPIQTLYRNMWSEIVATTVSNKAEGSSLPYTTYVSTILPDTIERYRSSWQLEGANGLFAYLPKSYTGSGRLVVVAKYRNIQVSRRFKSNTGPSPAIRIPIDYWDGNFGMYYQGDGLNGHGPRTYFSAKTTPYERIPNALSKASFNVPPQSW